FEDERGFFFEAFNQKKFNNLLGQDITFVQDNHSKSKQGVLRGLHYQKAPFAQAKLVRVTSGEIFDVAVDIRIDSPTYGQWSGEILSAQNKKQLWIPEGFAHGFLVLSDEAEVIYKTTQFYSKDHENCIAYNDKKINITWPSLAGQYILSPKDLEGGSIPNE
ncbi:MAG: dTDP-4-dehydrorhamnose 3,5-epimerase, partial [Methylophilaceae bacterium]